VCTVSLKAGLSTYNRFARGTLNAPESEAAEANPSIMGVARETPASTTGRLVRRLEAKGQEKGEDTFDKRLAVCHQAEVGGFVSKINSDGTVFSRRFGRYAHVLSLRHQVS
jgi:hypothetical protein